MAAGFRPMPSGNMAASDFVPQPGRPDLTICQLCIIDERGTSGRARFAARKGRAASAGSWSPDAGGGAEGRRGLVGHFLGQNAQAVSTFGHFRRMKPNSTDNRANKSPGNKGCPVSRYSASPLKKCPKVETRLPSRFLAPRTPPVRLYSEQVVAPSAQRATAEQATTRALTREAPRTS